MGQGILHGTLLIGAMIWVLGAVALGTGVIFDDPALDSPFGRILRRHHPWAACVWPIILAVAFIWILVTPPKEDD